MCDIWLQTVYWVSESFPRIGPGAGDLHQLLLHAVLKLPQNLSALVKKILVYNKHLKVHSYLTAFLFTLVSPE